MIAPYVDAEVAFAVRYHHQGLRFYPDEAFGIPVPMSASSVPNYRPGPYLGRAHEYCCNQKWYETAKRIRLIGTIRSGGRGRTAAL